MKVGEYFRVEHKGTDRSYSEDFFLCLGVEEGFIIGARLFPYLSQVVYTFNYKNWTVYEVSYNAIGLSFLGKN